jgi:energy-coupling factor transport system substrate-specific component
MWKSPQMIVLTAVVAAVYAAAYITLSPLSLHIIPGVLSFSFRDCLILVFGVLFGPAAAWGLGIGNLIGDFFTGSLGVGSVFGFVTNFLVAYLGYTLWTRYGPAEEHQETNPGRARQLVLFLCIGLLSAAAGAMVLAWGLNMLGVAPFRVVGVSIFANLLIGGWVGGVLYSLLARRISAIGMTWTAIMSEEGAAGAGRLAWLGLALAVFCGIGGFTAGMLFRSNLDLTSALAIPVVLLVVGAALL